MGSQKKCNYQLMNQFYFIITFFCVLFVETIYAQNYIEIKGKIIDSEYNAPLPFVNISVAKNRIGTITNNSGEFLLKIPEIWRNDTLNFSFIGYTTKKIPIKSFTNESTIVLQTSDYTICEISVFSYSPTEIILKAFENIPQNYPQSSARFTAFYREQITENMKDIQHIEAIVDIHKGSYTDSKDNDMVSIIKGRQRSDVQTSTLWDYLYFINGPYELIQLDFVKHKNKFIPVSQNTTSFLDERNFRFFNYTIKETFVEGKSIYLIEFYPKSDSNRGIFNGKIVLEKSTLAFMSLEFWFTPNRINSAHVLRPETEIALYDADVDAKALDYYCLVLYKEYEGHWYLSSTKLEYSFLFLDRRNQVLSTITNKLQLVVTDVNATTTTPFPRRNQVRADVELTKQLGETDPKFWENFNYIPTESIENQDKK